MKILIIRFSSIGDIVMTTPVIRCVKKQLNAEVHFITKKQFVETVEHNPYIDHLYRLDNNWTEIVHQLKKVDFDYIIDLHNNLRSKRLTLALKKKARRINKLSIHKEVLIRTGISNLPDLHFAERGLETIRNLGVENDGEGMDFYVPASAQKEIPFKPGTYVTLALATAHETKNIPEKMISQMIEKSNLPVVLLGGPKEAELGEKMAAVHPHIAVNMAGKCNLLVSTAYVENSKYLIAGDTGLMHIAAALAVPTISLWGATIPEFGVFPYYGNKKIKHFIHEVSLNCRPCSKHGSSKCPKKHYNCMYLQNMPEIFEHMNQLEQLNPNS